MPLSCRALIADAQQTYACWYLSVVTLAGLALNPAFGWWWADPVAALGIVVLLVRERIEVRSARRRSRLRRDGQRVTSQDLVTTLNTCRTCCGMGRPFALFSGGALLPGSVARTDLIAPDQTELLARALYRYILTGRLTSAAA